MIEAIIFDFDGVIIDSERKSVVDNLEFLKKNGIVSPNEREIKALVGTTDTDNYRYMSKVLNISFEEAETKLSEYIDKHPYTKELIFPEVYPLLKEFHSKYKLAIASNSPLSFVEKMTESSDIRKYFDKIISGRELGSVKPDPGIYLYARKILNVSSDKCLVVEDSPLGILAGKAAIMKVVGRYDRYLDLDVSQADYVISNLLELRDVIRKENEL